MFMDESPRNMAYALRPAHADCVPEFSSQHPPSALSLAGVIWHRHSMTVSAFRLATFHLAALPAIQLGGPQGETARLIVEGIRGVLKVGGRKRTREARLSSAVSGCPEVHPPVLGMAPTPPSAGHSCGQEATRYWLSRQRWNRATLLTTTAYGFRAIISA